MRFIFEHRASIILFNVLKNCLIEDSDKMFLLPANVCPIVPLTFLKANVKFKFIDINDENKCIDEKLVLTELTRNKDNYLGLLYVRSYGQESDVKDFFKEVKSLSNDLFIIDDRCLTVPDPYLENFDSNVDLLLYSTGYSKFVELGYGGFAYLRDNYNYRNTKLPFNEKDQEFQTTLLRDCIENDKIFQYVDNSWLGDTNFTTNQAKYRREVYEKIQVVSDHKRLINEIYDARLPIKLRQPISNTWRYNINVKDKKRVLDEIFASGLFASSHYASISCSFGFEECIIAKKSNDTTINLFNDHRVNSEFANRICDVLIRFID